MNNEQNIELLKQAVELKFGHKPNSPSDFDSLSTCVQSATNKSLGVSTLKRLWGYVKSTNSPTYTTLSVLARYAGFRDWYAFCSKVNKDNESGFSKDDILISSELDLGIIIKVEWNENKWCCIRKVEQPTRFLVVDANNIKLHANDTITVDSLSIGGKFVATDCKRGNTGMGTYLGAKREGIITLSILDTL
ncbi:MAG: hypothetical protein K2K52_05280 [Paramuribaculum sp.]|nr:hypothetical protein [Paramuribaculum sp.]